MERRDFLKSLAIGSVACSVGLAGCRSLSSREKVAICAPCGKLCSACPAKEAGKCGGCRSAAAAANKADCPIRSCVAKKGFRTCAECPGFPCAKLQEWAKKSEANQEALKRLQALRAD